MLRFLSLGLLVLIGSIPLLADEPGGKPDPSSVTKAPFGKTKDGVAVDIYTLKAAGLTAKVMTYGGILTELHVPDKNGKTADVVLGFDTLEGYLAGHPYFGANVGRVANRIAKGKFSLGGKEYKLAVNNGPNALHGGEKGFDKQVWAVEKTTSEPASVTLSYTSKDGEEGYPGTLKVLVTYALTKDRGLKIDYTATTDKTTIVNMAHHSYFNLAGHDAGSILGHELQIRNCDTYNEADETTIPTGKLLPMKGTPFDFTEKTAMGKNIGLIKGEPGGYDLNYVRNAGRDNELRMLAPLATVTEPKSGRTMEVVSTDKGVQFYTGNYLSGDKGKGGAEYKKNFAFCLEPQHMPDSINNPKAPTIVLEPGETYNQTTIYRFSVAK